MTSQSSIWSPAAIPPVNDILNSNSCMQRGGYPMSNTQTASYPHQNYGHSSYYSDMGYLNHMQLPVMSNQMNQMNANQVSYGSMPAPQIPRSNHTDCLEYKDTSSWPKFQVLWFKAIYVDWTKYSICMTITFWLTESTMCADCLRRDQWEPASMVVMETQSQRARGASGRLRTKKYRASRSGFSRNVFTSCLKNTHLWYLNVEV